MEAIERRFGDSHMQEVFRVQLNNRVQKRGETLQQLQSDIERLVFLGYPTAGEEITNLLAVDAFIRAISDVNLQRAIRTAGKQTLPEALSFALVMEASELASGIVQQVKEAPDEECSCQRGEVRRNQREGLRCWNCNRTGHLQGQCRLPPRRHAPQHFGSRETLTGQWCCRQDADQRREQLYENGNWRHWNKDSKYNQRLEGNKRATVQRVRAEPIYGRRNRTCRSEQQQNGDMESILAGKKRLVCVHERTRQKINDATSQMKKEYDIEGTPRGFQAGDCVCRCVCSCMRKRDRGKQKVFRCDRLHRYRGEGQDEFDRDDQI